MVVKGMEMGGIVVKGGFWEIGLKSECSWDVEGKLCCGGGFLGGVEGKCG